jgi:hypothetical protein
MSLRSRNTRSCYKGGFAIRCSRAGILSSTSVPPEALKPIGRQFGVSHGMLNVLVAEVVLKRARVMAVICELITAGVAQHVRMDWKCQCRHLASSCEHLSHCGRSHRPAALCGKHVGTRVFALKRPQGTQLRPRSGCVVGTPFFSRFTCNSPCLRSIWPIVAPQVRRPGARADT